MREKKKLKSKFCSLVILAPHRCFTPVAALLPLPLYSLPACRRAVSPLTPLLPSPSSRIALTRAGQEHGPAPMTPPLFHSLPTDFPLPSSPFCHSLISIVSPFSIPYRCSARFSALPALSCLSLSRPPPIPPLLSAPFLPLLSLPPKALLISLPPLSLLSPPNLPAPFSPCCSPCHCVSLPCACSCPWFCSPGRGALASRSLWPSRFLPLPPLLSLSSLLRWSPSSLPPLLSTATLPSSLLSPKSRRPPTRLSSSSSYPPRHPLHSWSFSLPSTYPLPLPLPSPPSLLLLVGFLGLSAPAVCPLPPLLCLLLPCTSFLPSPTSNSALLPSLPFSPSTLRPPPTLPALPLLRLPCCPSLPPSSTYPLPPPSLLPLPSPLSAS
ncbi:hypothetical protein C7M84_018605 [Penaeus vannamei]|uniref:Uncharacterized protein n=1 Tax=Penaeus vannamei TaxID=6689 RepID=A0A423SH45_PENVA|nr:hypothetical protein C7M84_018605 [Penaeus vannamei]